MIEQTLTGKFVQKLKGIPFIFTGNTTLETEKSIGKVYSFHIGPLVIGFTRSYKRK